MMQLNIATQVAGMMLHYATADNFVAVNVQREALSKVELVSNSPNDCSNNKNCEEYLWQDMLHSHFLCNLCYNKLQHKLYIKLPIATLNYFCTLLSENFQQVL